MRTPLLTSEQLQQVQAWLRDCTRFVLCAHVSPDGDALGSTLALASYLKGLGKSVAVIMPNAFPHFLDWLKGSEEVLCYDRQPERAGKLIREAEVIGCLDFNDPSRLEELGEQIRKSKADFWMIDHHLQPVDFCKVTVSFPDACSTCELVFRIIWQLGGLESLSFDAAEALYCGMCTDTGGFTYNSNRSDIFYIISLLLEKGIDKDLIYRRIYHNYSEGRMRLMGYVLHEKLQVISRLHAAYYTLTREELKQFDFQKGDAEGLVNMPLSIQGMKLSIALREDQEKQRVMVSLRSVDDFPCNEMAEAFFHGGGHKNASGGRLDCTMEEAVAVVRQAIAHYESLLADKNSY